VSYFGEESKNDSIISEPIKKAGCHSHRKKQETKANKEKERDTQ
jgi:hypothetical protein